jgi:hypothetical protein
MPGEHGDFFGLTAWNREGLTHRDWRLLLIGLIGALGGTRTPNLLIRSGFLGFVGLLWASVGRCRAYIGRTTKRTI